ncbi:MAG: hypothetical protein FWD66_09435 [Paludibacter sp.]|nr:hypothetical protein [Paludibacter sp.]
MKTFLHFFSTIQIRPLTLVIMLSVGIGTFAQPVTSVPYFCGFEDQAENAKWVLNPIPNQNPLINNWVIGDIVRKTGESGLYIYGFSPTKDLPQSDNAKGINIAYREFTLPAGKYDISFDWRMYGDSIFDALYVYWVNSSIPVDIYSINTLPAYDPDCRLIYTNLYPQTKNYLSGTLSWQQAIATLPEVIEGQSYKLVFLFTMTNELYTYSPLASIDNINICKKSTQNNNWANVSDITVYPAATNDKIVIAWKGIENNQATYDVMYQTEGDMLVKTITSLTDTSVAIPYSDLANGIYTFWVRAVYPDNTCIWIEKSEVSLTVNAPMDTAPNACPEISFNNQAELIDGDKYFIIECGVGNDTTFNITPIITVPAGGSITGYQVFSIPFDPPFPIGPTAGANLVFGSGLSDDVWGPTITLPFTFCFFENTYNQAVVGANGLISFNNHNYGDYCPYNLIGSPNIPSPSFHPGGSQYNVFNSIYGVYEDTYPPSCYGTSGVYAGVLGTFPCRTLTVSTYNVPLFANTSQYQSYQTVLYEGTNVIDVYIQHRELANSGWNQQIGIIGVINSNGTNGIAAPGRNTNSPQWSVINDSQREGWRFAPITSAPSYNVTWYQGAGFDGPVLGTGDSYELHIGDGIDTVTVRLVINNTCTGAYLEYADTAIVQWKNFATDSVLIDTTLCRGEVYTNYGFNESNSGIYSNILKNINGCDSLYCKLDLTINEIYSHSQRDTICYGESITYRDSIFNTTGIYSFIDKYSMTNCDSLQDTLYLTVLPPVMFNITVQDANTGPYSGVININNIPPGGYYTINGVVNGQLTNLHAGSYTIIVYNAKGCMSLPQTVYITTDCVGVDFYPIADVCADDPQITIPYIVNRGLVHSYSLEFDAAALATGFTNITNKPLFPTIDAPSSFDIPLPPNVRPGNYQVMIKFEDYGCEDTVFTTLNFSILYASSIIAQKWNDVLAVYNQNYNGGYVFSGFKWYYNGKEIPNETQSYYYVGSNGEILDTLGYYQVGLQRVGEIEYILSCLIEPEFHNANQYSIRPTIISSSQPITIIFGLKQITVSIYDYMGVRLSVQQFTGGAAQMVMPAKSGIYTVELVEEQTGKRVIQKVLVQ